METSEARILKMVAALASVALVTLGCSVVEGGFGLSQNVVRPTGPETKQTRSVSAFDKIEVGGLYDVDVRIGNRSSLTLEAPKDLLPYLTSQVSGGTLILGVNTRYDLSNNRQIKAHIEVPRLQKATISGVVKMAINGQVRGGSFDGSASGATSLRMSASVDSFKLDASGASHIQLDNISARDLKVVATGAAQCKIAGKVVATNIDASGACHLECGSLNVDRAVVRTSGASNANLHVANSLNASASGASNIVYSGNPSVQRSTSGVANVSRRG